MKLIIKNYNGDTLVSKSRVNMKFESENPENNFIIDISIENLKSIISNSVNNYKKWVDVKDIIDK